MGKGHLCCITSKSFRGRRAKDEGTQWLEKTVGNHQRRTFTEEILRELQGAKKSDDAPEGLDDLIKSIQNESKREEKEKRKLRQIVKSVGKAKEKTKTKGRRNRSKDFRITWY